MFVRHENENESENESENENENESALFNLASSKPPRLVYFSV